MKVIEKKTSKMKFIEDKFGVPLEELLRCLYVDQNKSFKQMEKELGLNQTLIIAWLKKAGIYSRRLKL